MLQLLHLLLIEATCANARARTCAHVAALLDQKSATSATESNLSLELSAKSVLHLGKKSATKAQRECNTARPPHTIIATSTQPHYDKGSRGSVMRTESTAVANTPKKERLELILEHLESGEELGVYDLIVKFRIDKSTVYRDMGELERYEGIQKKMGHTEGSRGGETVWFMPCGSEPGVKAAGEVSHA